MSFLEKAKPYLQLVRLPNVFTAAADSWAGWLVAAGTFAHPERWGLVVGASMLIYAGGIALNDAFDADEDLLERPGRPVAAGRVSLGSALVLAYLLLGTGLTMATFGSVFSGHWPGLAIAPCLVACVVAYDGGGKKTPLGPLLMGLCRGLNLLMGMALAPGYGGPSGWSAALGVTLFVAGITVISRSETSVGKRAGTGLGLVLESLGLTLVAVACVQPWGGRAFSPWSGLVVLAVVVVFLARAGSRAWTEATPRTTQRAVKAAVFSLVWLNVALVAALRGPFMALPVAALWLPAYLLGKWLYST